MRLRISPLCVFVWRNGQMVCDDPRGTAAMYFHLASRTTGADDFRSAAEDTAWLLEFRADRAQPPEVKEYADAERLPLPPCGNAPLAAPAPAEAARQDAMLHGGPASFSFAGDAWDGLGP